MRADRLIAAIALTAFALATVAGHRTSDAQVLLSEEWWENVVKKWNERLKHVYFVDQEDHDCPTFTTLIYSAQDRLGLMTPQYFDPSASHRVVGMNLPSITYEKAWSCRYTVTARRFDRDNGSEKEVLPKQVDLKARAESTKALIELAKKQEVVRLLPESELPPPEGEAKATDPVQPVPLYNLPKPRAKDSLVNRHSVDFDNPKASIAFTGILYFAPRSFSVHLANVDDDLTLGSRADRDAKQYELSFINSSARVTLEVTKEVYKKRWIKVFGD
jgi:hypothetical protein